jgi:hypothetical protein
MGRPLGSCKQGLFTNEAWLRRKYLSEKLSSYQIANLCGVSPPTILKHLRSFGIPRRPSGSDGSQCLGLRRKVPQASIFGL